jgi:hypothetical protein
MRSRLSWALYLVAIIAIGILSRVVHTGSTLIDKYLGDALYAAMVYVILRLRWMPPAAALSSMIVMTAIEFFQLTMIPAHFLASPHLIVRIFARLMGTEFSLLDLLAYAVGITGVYLMDSLAARKWWARQNSNL